MAKKLRTGFEFPITNSGVSTSSIVYENANFHKYMNNVTKSYQSFSKALSSIQSVTSFKTGERNHIINYSANGRTLVNSLGSSFIGYGRNGSYDQIQLDTNQFSNGIFINYWQKYGSYTTVPIFRFSDGSSNFVSYVDRVSNKLEIYNQNTSTIVATTFLSLGINTYYNFSIALNNSGQLTLIVNGTTLNYNTSISFANVTHAVFGVCSGSSFDSSFAYIDDLAINDGSGSTDNGIPNSIRAYNFFDQATLDSQTGFSTVGGSTILANLTDGDDSTRVTASNDLSEMNFSLPSLSSTGMSETASNFSKIDAINIFARQIEATKANSVLKAKIIDSITNANREENISLPLTVANQSTTIFDDGSNDFSLANLDSGNLDLKITFDKP